MSSVFVLQHEYEWCGHDEVKMVGVYLTEADATAAVQRLREQPGFRDWPDGFSIDSYEHGEVDEPEIAKFAQDDVVRSEERSVLGHGERSLVVTEHVRNGSYRGKSVA